MDPVGDWSSETIETVDAVADTDERREVDDADVLPDESPELESCLPTPCERSFRQRSRNERPETLLAVLQSLINDAIAQAGE